VILVVPLNTKNSHRHRLTLSSRPANTLPKFQQTMWTINSSIASGPLSAGSRPRKPLVQKTDRRIVRHPDRLIESQ